MKTQIHNRQRSIALASIVVATSLLTACGGGTTSDSVATTSTPVPILTSTPTPTSTATPTPTPSSTQSGNYSDCSNSALLGTGNNYQIDTKSLTNGTVTTTQTNKYKVNGLTTFKGNGAVELQTDTTVLTGANAGSVVTVKTYSQLTSSTYSTYGATVSLTVPGLGNYMLTSSFTPAIQYPVTLAANTPFQQTYTTKSDSSSAMVPAATDVAQTTTLTFLGVENVTVAAGTFLACKTKTDTLVNGITGTAMAWTVAAGRYQGLNLKFDDQKGNVVETTKLLFNGS